MANPLEILIHFSLSLLMINKSNTTFKPKNKVFREEIIENF